MPIPQVFGTEHEYVIHIPDAALPFQEKWYQEKIMAIALLQDFWRKFFPDITDDPYFIKEREIERDYDEEPRDPRGMVLPFREDEKPSGNAKLIVSDFMGGFMTPLGSRFYIDHGYFEGSSPECDDPFLLLSCEMAQEELLVSAFEKRFADHPLRPRLYKNVSDGQGHSQAAHRNLCVAAHFWPLLVSYYSNECRHIKYLTRATKLLLTWHVVEQIFTGAGKYGDEMATVLTGEEEQAAMSVFQISGRADFACRLVGGETTDRRPIVNQRYESLANPDKYSRYHCICGDANRAEWPHLFKMGLTALVLGMLEDDELDLGFYVKDPVNAIKDVSRDPTCKKPISVIPVNGGREFELSSLEIMNVFLNEMGRYLGSRPVPAWAGKIYEKAVWASWALANEPRLLETVLDWKIKERFKGRPKAFDEHIAYHALAAPHMLYNKLVRAGMVETVISGDEIAKYKQSPPETTRAYFRGKFIKKFYSETDHSNTDWDAIVLRTNNRRTRPRKIVLGEPLGLTRSECGHIFEGGNIPTIEHFENMFVVHDFIKTKEASYGGPGAEEI